MSGETYDVRDFLIAARKQRQELDDALERAATTKHQHEKAHADLAESYRAAIADLGAAILPRLDAASVGKAIRLTGYAPFINESPEVPMVRARESLRARKAVIESDRRFAERELQRHPRTGSLVVRRAEVLEHRKPWGEVLINADHPRLERLIDSGYDTPDHSAQWWRLSYYQDWEAADEIIERFPGKTFAQIRAEVLQARETVATFEQQQNEIDAEIAAGEALDREHDHIAAQLQTLEHDYLEGARKRLVEHLLALDPKSISPRLAEDPDVQLHYLRASGLHAKGRYLSQMVEHQVVKYEQDLRAVRQKLDRDIGKYQRPKNAYARFPAEAFARRFRPRRERDEKHWKKFQQSYTTIYVYDRYDRARMLDDFLWWELMTAGRYDGRYLPEVSHWYDQHPGHQYTYDRDEESDQAAADDAAAAVLVTEADHVDETSSGSYTADVS